jgi:hypothetical protein
MREVVAAVMLFPPDETTLPGLGNMRMLGSMGGDNTAFTVIPRLVSRIGNIETK